MPPTYNFLDNIPLPIPLVTPTDQTNTHDQPTNLGPVPIVLPGPVEQPTPIAQPASPRSPQPASPNQQPINNSPAHTPLQPTPNPILVIPNPSVNTHPMVTRAKADISIPIEHMNCHVTAVSPLPHSHVHALCDPQRKQAMLDEYNALITNGTWVLVPCPANVNIVRSMWLFR